MPTFFEWVALAALLSIWGEWTYVVLWTRRFGKSVVAGLLKTVTNLRPGRGTGTTAREVLVDAAERAAAAPSRPTKGAPPLGALGISDDLIAKGAKALGLPFEQAKALAEQYLGQEGAGGAAGGSDPIGSAIAKLATGGKLSDEEKASAIGAFIDDIRRGPATPQGGAPEAPSASGSWA